MYGLVRLSQLLRAYALSGRCMACYDCPSCSHTLSVRATNMSATDGDGQMTPRKVYYLACGFCRWTSRDIGLKDQSVCECSYLDANCVVSMACIVRLVHSELLDKH